MLINGIDDRYRGYTLRISLPKENYSEDAIAGPREAVSAAAKRLGKKVSRLNVPRHVLLLLTLGPRVWNLPSGTDL